MAYSRDLPKMARQQCGIMHGLVWYGLVWDGLVWFVGVVSMGGGAI